MLRKAVLVIWPARDGVAVPEAEDGGPGRTIRITKTTEAQRAMTKLQLDDSSELYEKADCKVQVDVVDVVAYLKDYIHTGLDEDELLLTSFNVTQSAGEVVLTLFHDGDLPETAAPHPTHAGAVTPATAQAPEAGDTHQVEGRKKRTHYL